MLILSRQPGQIIRVMCGNAYAEIFVRKVGRSNVELGFTGQKDQISFVRGEKEFPNDNKKIKAKRKFPFLR